MELQIYSETGEAEQLRAIEFNESGKEKVVWTSPRAPHGAWQSLVCAGADYMDDFGIVRTNPPEYHAIIAWLKAGLSLQALNSALMTRLYNMNWVDNL